MNRNKILLSLGMLMAAPYLATAQDTGVEMADLMRSNGKIYVVVACALVIFIGIVIYMIILDRKMMRLEKIRRSEDKKHA